MFDFNNSSKAKKTDITSFLLVFLDKKYEKVYVLFFSTFHNISSIQSSILYSYASIISVSSITILLSSLFNISNKVSDNKLMSGTIKFSFSD